MELEVGPCDGVAAAAASPSSAGRRQVVADPEADSALAARTTNGVYRRLVSHKRAPTRKPDFGLKTTESDGRVVLAVRGEVDIATVGMLDEALRDQLAAGPVLLDMSDLTFMDSCGVRLLDAILRDSDSEGWTFAIGADLQRSVRHILDLTGLTKVLPFEVPPGHTREG